MTPKLEEQLIAQEQQLALLAAIIHAGRCADGAVFDEKAMRTETKYCVDVAAQIQQAARNRMA